MLFREDLTEAEKIEQAKFLALIDRNFAEDKEAIVALQVVMRECIEEERGDKAKAYASMAYKLRDSFFVAVDKGDASGQDGLEMTIMRYCILLSTSLSISCEESSSIT